MLVVTRHRVPVVEADGFQRRAEVALAALAGRPGFVRGTLGRAVDDGDLWVLASEWESVGAYRRALSSYEVKVDAVPLLLTAQDEPSAFEPLVRHEGGQVLRWTPDRAPDADEAAPTRSRPGPAVR